MAAGGRTGKATLLLEGAHAREPAGSRTACRPVPASRGDLYRQYPDLRIARRAIQDTEGFKSGTGSYAIYAAAGGVQGIADAMASQWTQ